MLLNSDAVANIVCGEGTNLLRSFPVGRAIPLCGHLSARPRRLFYHPNVPRYGGGQFSELSPSALWPRALNAEPDAFPLTDSERTTAAHGRGRVKSLLPLATLP